MSSVTIPPSVTHIGNGAFMGCTNLLYIDVLPQSPPTTNHSYPINIKVENPFQNTNNCPIYVPSQSVDLYKSTEIWKENKDRIKAK